MSKHVEKTDSLAELVEKVGGRWRDEHLVDGSARVVGELVAELTLKGDSRPYREGESVDLTTDRDGFELGQRWSRMGQETSELGSTECGHDAQCAASPRYTR